MPAHYLRVFCKRGVMYWLLVRLALLMVGGGQSGQIESVAALSVDLLTFNPLFAVIAAAVTGFLAWTEMQLHGERVLAGNLGVWRGSFALVPAAVAFSCDGVIALIFALL